MVFSGHKIYGPTGIGVLYGKESLLEQLPPYQGGGEMIARVSFEHTTFERLPYKFEAGTPDYVGTHALATIFGLYSIDRFGQNCSARGGFDAICYAAYAGSRGYDVFRHGCCENICSFL